MDSSQGQRNSRKARTAVTHREGQWPSYRRRELQQGRNWFPAGIVGATVTRTAGAMARRQVSSVNRALRRGRTGDTGQGFLVKKPQNGEAAQKSKTKQNTKKQC